MTTVANYAAVTILTSDIAPVDEDIILDMVALFRRATPHTFAGAQFFSDAGGASPVVPSAGAVAFSCMPATTAQYEPFVPEIVNADTPETVSVAAPPLLKVKASPSMITGASHWRIVVTSYHQ